MKYKEKLKEFFHENFMLERDNSLSDDESLLDKGIIDSTGVLELVMFIEEQFGISVDDEDIIPENLDSFNKLEHYIDTKKASQT